MHTTTDYSDIKDPNEKRKAALADIKDWLGLRKYNQFLKDARECQPPLTYVQLNFTLMVAGIQGYPVKAMAEELGIPIPTQTDEQTGGHNE